METAADADHHQEVLEQGELARAAIRAAKRDPGSEDKAPAVREGVSDVKDTDSDDHQERDELSPLALALEVSAAGNLGLWACVSPIMSRAMNSPALRGVAGARLYSALIRAATACGHPRRGLEVFREMEGEHEAAARSSGGGKSQRKRGRSAAIPVGCGPLPSPNSGTFLAALDACAAVGGWESVELAIEITKSAASATMIEAEIGESNRGTRPVAKLSADKLAVVLGRAGEVCSAAGAHPAALALRAKAEEIGSTKPRNQEADRGGDGVGSDNPGTLEAN